MFNLISIDVSIFYKFICGFLFCNVKVFNVSKGCPQIIVCNNKNPFDSHMLSFYDIHF